MADKKTARPLEEREQEMIKVIGDYLIDTDADNYIVRLKGVSAPLAYFDRFDSALSYILEELKKNRLKSDARSIEDAIGIIKSTNDEVINLIKYAFPEYEILRK